MANQFLKWNLLDFLRQSYPRAVVCGDIYAVFYSTATLDAVRESLHYLAEKHYVECREAKHPVKRGEKIQLYKLTAAGIDLLDGVTQDDGVPEDLT